MTVFHLPVARVLRLPGSLASGDPARTLPLGILLRFVLAGRPGISSPWTVLSALLLLGAGRVAFLILFSGLILPLTCLPLTALPLLRFVGPPVLPTLFATVRPPAGILPFLVVLAGAALARATLAVAVLAALIFPTLALLLAAFFATLRLFLAIVALAVLLGRRLRIV